MHYYSYNQYLKERFGEKVRRLSLNAGFSCPGVENGRGNCIFCNEYGFSRFSGNAPALEEQIASLIESGKVKFGVRKFIAYFQNGTNTNAKCEELKKAYDVIRKFPEIAGLSISTRPDAVDDWKLALIESYADDYDVWIEYGVQTVHDKTLKFLNRGHTFGQSIDAIEKTARRKIKVGVHIILGLPGETHEHNIATAKEISRLPVSAVKLHVLHVLKDTKLEKLYYEGGIPILTRDEYVNAVCDFLYNLRRDCVVLRLVSDVRKGYLIAPDWLNDKAGVIREINLVMGKRMC